MSFSAENWAWEQTCSSGIAKSVLVYLAKLADGNGECWPGILTICKRVQHGERAVRKAIASLIKSGLLEVDHRFSEINDAWLSSLYRVPVAAAGAAEPPKDPTCEKAGDPTCEKAGPPPANSQGNPITYPTSTEIPEKTPTTRVRARESEPPGFAEFYASYPRKKGRRDAARAFAKAVARGNAPEDITAGLRRHRFTPNPRFHPYPASWLNGDCWADEPDKTVDERLMEVVGLNPEAMADHGVWVPGASFHRERALP